MSYLVLARKYRPQTFNEVYAQDHITRVLKNSIELDRIAQAYLFTGTRGVGKTSMARILAKSLNCLEGGPTVTPCNKCENCVEITNSNSRDVIEIDGASNTGVDDIRELQKELMYSATSSKYKIYIIDEVHMLSNNAFNALLKTLEEPPPNVIFIFATTEPHKVLPTIISRCQRFDFKRIPIQEIIERLRTICEAESINIEEDAFFVIAQKADGSMRDALSLLDQVIAYGNDIITLQTILNIFGIVHQDVYNQLVSAIHKKENKVVITLLHEILETGTDIQEFINGFLTYLRNLLLLKVGLDIPEVTKVQFKKMSEISFFFSEDDILYLMSILIKTKTDIKTSSNPLLLTEMSFIKLTKFASMKSIEDIINSIDKIDNSREAIPEIKPEINFKRTQKEVYSPEKRISNPKLQDIERKPDKKKKIPEPKIEKITKEVFLQEQPKIIERLGKERKFIKNYLVNCVFDGISNNMIKFIVQSNTAHKRLNDERSKLENIYSNYFGRRIKVHFELQEKKIKVIKKKMKLPELKKIDPEIANFIEILDPEAEIKVDLYLK